VILDHEIHMALRARLEAVAEIPPPADRSWPNVDFTPPVDRAHIESDYVPGPRPVITMPTSTGVVEASGLFVVRYCGLTDRGESIITEVAAAILEAFRPGTSETLASGNVLRIRGDLAPYPSQILPTGDTNKSRCTITIPWRCYATNTVS
jgi:hypothetical protein